MDSVWSSAVFVDGAELFLLIFPIVGWSGRSSRVIVLFSVHGSDPLTSMVLRGSRYPINSEGGGQETEIGLTVFLYSKSIFWDGVGWSRNRSSNYWSSPSEFLGCTISVLLFF